MMSTAMREDADNVTSRPWITVFGKLLAAAVILTPLVAMLFPELNHCSGNTPSESRRGESTGRPRVAQPALCPFSVKRSDP